MDEGNSRRSLSPYHEKCFPPYCDSAQQVDKAMVSKMARGDLEDKYIIFADENLELKKQNRNQERQIQRLQTAIQRQDKLDKRSGATPTSMMVDTNKVAILEAQNKNLQAKIKVLKQQLMNHSWIHSKESRINEAKMRQVQAKTPRDSEFQIPSQTHSAREAKPDKNLGALKVRVAELEDQLETQKNKYKARIAQLEKELSALEKEAEKSGTSVHEQLSETSRQVKDNKELIKLRMQAEKQAAELDELREKLKAADEEIDKLKKEVKDAKDRADDLEKQLENERNKSRSAISGPLKSSAPSETADIVRRALEEQIRDLQNERDTLKDTNEKLLKLTQSKSEKSMKVPSGHTLQISQLEQTLKDKMDELEEKEARIRELEKKLAEAEKALAETPIVEKVPSQSGVELALDKSVSFIALAVDTGSAVVPHPHNQNPRVQKISPDVNFTVQKYWRNVEIYEALLDINRQFVQAGPSNKECDNCVDLSKQLDNALMDNEKLRKALEIAQKPKTPPPTPKGSETELNRLRDEVEKLRDDADSLRDEVGRLRDEVNKLMNEIDKLKNEKASLENQLSDATNELNTLRPIAAEHKACQTAGPLPHTSSNDSALRKQNQRLEDELNRAWQELNAVRPIVEEHNRSCNKSPTKAQTHTSTKSIQFPSSSLHSVNFKDLPIGREPSIKESKESREPSIKESKESREPSIKESEESVHSQKTIDSERYIALTRQLQEALRENERLKKELAYLDGDDQLKRQNQRLEDELNKALRELREVRPIVEDHNKHCTGPRKEYIAPEYPQEVAPATEYKQHSKERIQSPRQASPVQSYHSKKERRKQKWPDAKSVLSNTRKEEIQLASTERKLRDIVMESQMNSVENVKEQNPDSQISDNLIEEKSETLLKNKISLNEGDSESQAQNDDSLKEEIHPFTQNNEESKKSFKSESHNENVKEVTPESQEDSVLKQNKPIGSTSQVEDLSGELKKQSLIPAVVNVKRLLRRRTALHPSTPPHSLEKSPPPVEEEEAPPPRQDYVSHVSPPPSEHCVQTVDINDPAQRANLLIVSKHDFETVLMQKKRYSTEVEVIEPVDGRQTLNCKLEICMYDLDIDDRMLEYLSSIQPEPKVYVEWSFVGLDQRTAPLPAQQALFYTNVMYYGPLSSEIKRYLDKVEMPIDLYLVKSSGNPLKVAEGTLDMLPAMEQPNRGFIRSVFLRGKDLPSRYASDKAVATIHCSFILHECCLGDPPFRDQLEVAIGTLYLKNRDGGVVPDHATHIYIEYALLGHCGPDLETDSVPRGEVMKFNHSKKLRVNDENAPHLKAMLEDSDPKPLRFTVLAEPCSLTSDTEVETVGHADVNLNEEMIRKDRDLVSSQVPVFSNEGEHLGTLSVTVLGIGTLQEIYKDRRQAA